MRTLPAGNFSNCKNESPWPPLCHCHLTGWMLVAEVTEKGYQLNRLCTALSPQHVRFHPLAGIAKSPEGGVDSFRAE